MHFSSEFAMDPLTWGRTEHSISLGGIWQFTHYRFQRDQNAKCGIFMQESMESPFLQIPFPKEQ